MWFLCYTKSRKRMSQCTRLCRSTQDCVYAVLCCKTVFNATVVAFNRLTAVWSSTTWRQHIRTSQTEGADVASLDVTARFHSNCLGVSCCRHSFAWHGSRLEWHALYGETLGTQAVQWQCKAAIQHPYHRTHTTNINLSVIQVQCSSFNRLCSYVGAIAIQLKNTSFYSSDWEVAVTPSPDSLANTPLLLPLRKTCHFSMSRLICQFVGNCQIFVQSNHCKFVSLIA